MLKTIWINPSLIFKFQTWSNNRVSICIPHCQHITISWKLSHLGNTIFSQPIWQLSTSSVRHIMHETVSPTGNIDHRWAHSTCRLCMPHCFHPSDEKQKLHFQGHVLDVLPQCALAGSTTASSSSFLLTTEKISCLIRYLLPTLNYEQLLEHDLKLHTDKRHVNNFPNCSYSFP